MSLGHEFDVLPENDQWVIVPMAHALIEARRWHAWPLGPAPLRHGMEGVSLHMNSNYHTRKLARQPHMLSARRSRPACLCDAHNEHQPAH